MAKSPSIPEARAAQPLQLASELSRYQFVVAANAAAALFSGVEAIRRIQERTAHEAAKHHTAVAERLEARKHPADLAEVQQELVHFDLEGAMRYWRDIGAAMLETQSRVAACATRTLETEGLFAAMGAPLLHAQQGK